MQAIKKNDAIDSLMRQWRQEIHQHPETAYEEIRTSDKVAKLLESWGIEIHRGLAKTGVVGILKGSREGDMIGLRADMDALDINEANDFSYCSKISGKMHACGHDGHTAMLLGAAKYLSENRDFAGTAVFIFQPAEENVAGGKVMCDEGLFDLFPVKEVYGMHNWPQFDAGVIGVHDKEVMASFDVFDIEVHGKGCHAAQPQNGVDPILISSHIVTALQSVVSRNVAPSERAVVSVTQIHGGDMYNIIPGSVTISGGTRSFKPEVRELLKEKICNIATDIAKSLGGSVEIHYDLRYPPTINHPKQAQKIASAAQRLFGADRVIKNPEPDTSAEDFAIMLERKPGAYIWFGNGKKNEKAVLHNPHYDFNDEILADGASLWVEMVQSQNK
ncbi:MAG: amidohydrolase [Gammaproteobacteria bacterium]|nr:amidohydrolase [Gammaproteobacteria bacterium]